MTATPNSQCHFSRSIAHRTLRLLLWCKRGLTPHWIKLFLCTQLQWLEHLHPNNAVTRRNLVWRLDHLFAAEDGRDRGKRGQLFTVQIWTDNVPMARVEQALHWEIEWLRWRFWYNSTWHTDSIHLVFENKKLRFSFTRTLNILLEFVSISIF